MMKKIIFITFWLLFILCSCVFAAEINIGVAANFQQCINQIIAVYNIDKPIKINCVYGSSGKLFAQIKNGAPIDIYFSANSEYPRKLFVENVTVSQPEVYAKGQLVLWSKDEKDLSNGLKSVLAADVDKIAIADPKVAPYGIESIAALKSANIWEQIEDKIVYGSSIFQVNHFIVSKAVDMGITSLSSVIMLEEYRNQWIKIQDELYQPIEQAAVIINKGLVKQEVQDFYDFIFSDEAKVIIEKYGYKVE
ncbi:MAG: molybdate ABC transporter substrate-binding protein [Candidatus Omnitrophica bacterium]|nr:molybdate ABC transporter substrate-binding protein [Candidatus Omnitrophota bacterium]